MQDLRAIAVLPRHDAIDAYIRVVDDERRGAHSRLVQAVEVAQRPPEAVAELLVRVLGHLEVERHGPGLADGLREVHGGAVDAALAVVVEVHEGEDLDL